MQINTTLFFIRSFLLIQRVDLQYNHEGENITDTTAGDCPEDGKKSGWWNERRWRYGSLLGIIVLLTALYPFLDTTTNGMIFLQALISCMLILIIHTLSIRRTVYYIALILVIPALLLGWANIILNIPLLEIISGISLITVYALTVIILFRDLFSSSEITEDTVYGAICTYLLFGHMWGTAYYTIASLNPGAFLFDQTVYAGGPLQQFDLLYFSFITLTTTGYGDIVPTIGIVKMLALFETVIGTIFIAVFMARLVGNLAISAGKKKNE